MTAPRICTNNVPRPLMCVYELTDRQRAALGYTAEELERAEQDGESFVAYKGHVYSLQEFTRVPPSSPEFEGWNGAAPLGFSVGVLLKWADDGESVIVGTYIG